jgi:hypothetical protein
MKHQRQGVRSTRVREDTHINVPVIPKAKDVYIKVHNATETMHTDQTGRFPAKKCDYCSRSPKAKVYWAPGFEFQKGPG